MTEKFSPQYHQMPRFDIYRNEVLQPVVLGQSPKNILCKDVKIPESWVSHSCERSIRTKRELDELRKKEILPDNSYDLNNDGNISNAEYVIARRFDHNADGKLEPEERARAIEALRAGVESKFMWGLDKCGAQRGRRVLQVRGKIIDGEDFSPLKDSYPGYPKALDNSTLMTLAKLQERRKQDLVLRLLEAKDKWSKRHPNKVSQKFARSEFLVDAPKHTSISQIREELVKEARIKNGLTATTKDIKDRDCEDNIVANEQVRTQRELFGKRKQKNLQELIKFEHKHCLHNRTQLQSKEDSILRKNTIEGKTYREVVENLKRETKDHYTRTFGNVSIGLHGKELAKFADSSETREFWKFRNAYNVHPTIRANAKSLQIKTLLNNSVDISKTLLPLHKKLEVTQKVNEADFDSRINIIQRLKTIPRWTSTIREFLIKPKHNEKDITAIKEASKVLNSFSCSNDFKTILGRSPEVEHINSRIPRSTILNLANGNVEIKTGAF